MNRPEEPFLQIVDRRFAELTPAQKRIAGFLRENFRSAVFMPLAAVARETGVSEASIVRFARALGYEGFADMQSHMQEYVSQTMLSTVERFQLFSREREESALLEGVLHGNTEAIEELGSLVDAHTLREFVDGMSAFRRVYLAGFESTAGLAEYGGYFLSRSGFSASAVTERTGDLLPLLRQADDQTLVIALLLPRYPRSLIAFCRSCAEQGAQLAVIADSPDHPLQGPARHQFFVSRRPVQGMNLESHTAMLTLLQVMIQEGGLQDKERTRGSLEQLEAYNRRFGIFSSE
jgi:DNA-binding MurR/RpiR family transcriptional regulator